MKFKEGQLYALEIWDHASHSEEKIKHKVVGWVLKEDEVYVYLCWWDVLDVDEDTRKKNRESCSLVKSCITKRKLLKTS